MSRNKYLAIIIAIVLLVVAIVASLTEYREVSENKWDEKYDLDDKQPMGLYIFKELTNRYFKDIPITTDGTPEDTIGSNSLYIQIAPYYLDTATVDTLLSIASAGNDVLIIGNFLNDRVADTLPQYFEDIYVADSILSFNFTNSEIASDTNYSYQIHDEEFEPSSESFYLLQGWEWDEDLQFIEVATDDSLALMLSFPFGEGRVYYHMKKELIYNYSYRQPQMFEYTQKIFSHFDPQHVYLLDPDSENSANHANKNPLEYIMSQPALKAAYYLLLLGTLLYVFFGGKRKQKIIPVLSKNENTSLEYIATVSQLFYQQEQHEKIVVHMRNIFHHKMKKKFFVDPDHPNYVDILAKKSKISKTELQYIMDRFKNLDDNYSFRGDQLVSLNRRLESIYKEIKTK